MSNQSNQDENNTADTEDLMGYEATDLEVTLPETTNAVDAQTIINEAVKQVTVDDNGKYVYPEGMDPMLKAAVAVSKSFRDTQSGFTKKSMALKEAEAEVEALRERLAGTTKQSLELSPDKQQELDDLMFTDPQAWRIEMNKLEQQSSIEATEALKEVTKEVREKASAEYQLQQRVDYLEQFNSSRSVPITTDMLDNDVPKRINNKLAKNEVSFEEYLDEVSRYLETSKVVAQATPEQTADLNKANGSADGVSIAQQQEQAAIDYSQLTF